MRLAAALALAALIAGCAPGGGGPGDHRNLPGDSPRAAPGGQPTRAQYERMQRRLIARGLMRTDYAPADATYTNADLLRNFARVAFYAPGGRSLKNRIDDDPRRLRRWERPVRYALHGSGFTDGDRAEIASLMRRIADISGQTITEVAPGEDNFSIYLTTLDERELIAAGLAVPGADPGPARAFDFWRFGDEAVCVFNIENDGGELVRAHIFIGDEVTGLLRQSCFHEEIVQAMGLPNDHDRVRPSLFNDDEEFALFTEHDEWLLRLLYHPRLRAGMSVEEAGPVARRVMEDLRPDGH